MRKLLIGRVLSKANVHIRSFAALRGLQHRYADRAGRWRGGIVVSDPGGRRPGSLLFGGADRKEEAPDPGAPDPGAPDPEASDQAVV